MRPDLSVAYLSEDLYKIDNGLLGYWTVMRNMSRREVQCSLVNSDPDRVNASKEETPVSQNLSNLSLEEITEVKI